MRTNAATLVAFTLSLAACGTVAEPQPVQPAGPLEAAPPPLTAEALPQGTDLIVRLQEPLLIDSVRPGDLFTAAVTEPIIAENTHTVVPAGAVLTGMVTGVAEATESRPAALRVNFLRIRIDPATHPLGAEVLELESRGEGTVTLATGEVLDDLVAVLGTGAGVVVALEGADPAGLPEGTIVRLRTRDTLRLR